VQVRAFGSGAVGLQIVENVEPLTQKSMDDSGAAALTEGVGAAINNEDIAAATKSGQSKPNGSGKQAGGDESKAGDGSVENPDGVDDDDIAKAEAAEEDEDDAMEDDDQSSEEEESFRWRDAYKKYKSFPRQLKMYDTIWLCLFNAERKAILKALSRAEARGTEFHIEGLDEEEIEARSTLWSKT
jgi:hypothetical protein